MTTGASMEGTMIWFNEAKQHGFIRTDDGERLRVDEAGFVPGELLGQRCGGTRVRFERIGDEQDDARAVGVTVVPAAETQRARFRGRR
jgi:hypothetical protein